MPRKAKPADEGAVTESPLAPQVNDQIKQMTGFQDEKELLAALPETTTGPSETGEDRPRKKRRTKEEMAAARGGASADVVTDPLLLDKRYQKAIQNMNSDTGTGFVKGGFRVAALAKGDESWQLQSDEEEKTDDFFYVLSKKYGWFDPSKSPITMAIYFAAMLGTFIASRVLKGKGDDIYAFLTRSFGLGTDEENKDAAVTT